MSNIAENRNKKLENVVQDLQIYREKKTQNKIKTKQESELNRNFALFGTV